MHDLINDLARSVAGEFFLMLDNKMDISDENADLEKFHHISFFNDPFELKKKKFKELQRARFLRTFLAVPVTSGYSFYVSRKILTETVPKQMSLGIGGLTCLQTLSKVIIGEHGDDFKLSDLKGFLNIQGQLSIKRLHTVRNAVEAKDEKLHQKKVLDGLRPFEKLRSLSIEYYMGKEFPGWVGHSSFDCLSQLTLRDCKSCKYLPALGLLPSLENLFVEGIDGLERLGFEFFGHANSCDVVAFQSLEVLEFKDMKSRVEWSNGGGDITGAFPCLREIHIINCPKLDVVKVELTTLSLGVLHVEGCSLVMLRSIVARATRKYTKAVIWDDELGDQECLNDMNIDKDVDSETDGTAQLMTSNNDADGIEGVIEAAEAS
ncbi:hypothetical protein R6Q57_021330 [Mikania cordata]